MPTQLDVGGAIRKEQPCVDMDREYGFFLRARFLDIRSVAPIQVGHHQVTWAMQNADARHCDNLLEKMRSPSVGFRAAKWSRKIHFPHLGCGCWLWCCKLRDSEHKEMQGLERELWREKGTCLGKNENTN